MQDQATARSHRRSAPLRRLAWHPPSRDAWRPPAEGVLSVAPGCGMEVPAWTDDRPRVIRQHGAGRPTL